MIVLDLGSNTLRVLAVSCEHLEVLYSYSKVVKTADGLAQSGRISQDAVNRVIAAIKEAQEAFSFQGHPVKAVTTEALRQASNSKAVLEEIFTRCAVVFDVISGDEEARLTLMAVEHRLHTLSLSPKSFVSIDIGGGSTEVTFKYPHGSVSKSFPLGIVTLAQSYNSLASIKEALPEKMKSIERFANKQYEVEGKVECFVATAGTPTTVMAMKLGQSYMTYNAEEINGQSLDREELDFYLFKLLEMSFEERERIVGTGRSDLIAAGILIYQALYDVLGFRTGRVIDDGLREGLALDCCQSL